MAKKLLIVESPAKAHTIGKYLGDEFVVKSSVGHIRDLPKENSAIKIVANGESSWKFVPTYEVSEGKTKVVSELKDAVKKCAEIYLASDPDREGEAIAWHLHEVLAKTAGGKPFHRVTYNEITKSAVMKAIAEPREIDMPLVDAQQARRILDRLVGYKVSSLLWKNINCANNHALSAGRVQSVALRLLVERQREIDAFKPEVFYLLGVEAKKIGEAKTFAAKLARFDGEKPNIKTKEMAGQILLDLAGSSLKVLDVKLQPKVRHALPPFTTSTLQQAASSVLGFSPGKTMKLAQSLYEQGRITYMRTDSVNISEQAREAAKEFITKYCGAEFYPEKPNFFKSKGGAQEAHEAIRPTDIELSPKRANDQMDAVELKLYDLIWRRFVASQMADAKTTIKTIAIEPEKDSVMLHKYVFTASETIIDFEGFLKIMKLSLISKAKDGEDDDDSDEVTYLPEVVVGDPLEAVRWISDEKETKGPSHYSEASLIKALEENGVGRPSTYAATIETLKVREYAKTEKKKLVPLERGILVCDWLVKKLDGLFNVGYTAQMEAELDEVAEKGVAMDAMLSHFYVTFMKELEKAVDPPPPIEKFTEVFALLDQVKEWKPAKKVGNRTYDDKAFVESVKDQAATGNRPLSARQLQFLVRMVAQYSMQIPGANEYLNSTEAEVSAGDVVEHANPELVAYCFSIQDRIIGMDRNSFIRSIRDQWERGRPLSMKQFRILAKSVGDNSVGLPDSAEIREKLREFVPSGFSDVEGNPYVEKIFELLKQVKEWRPPTKHGKRVYNDAEFIKSLSDQYNNRRTLSDKQIAALKRVANIYKIELPDDPKTDKPE